jgi:hypothetical protein
MWVFFTSFNINTEVVLVPFNDVITGVGCSLSTMRNTVPAFSTHISNYQRCKAYNGSEFWLSFIISAGQKKKRNQHIQ